MPPDSPNPLTNRDLARSHPSIPPNPGITHIVFLRGLIEKVGRGTLLILEECRKHHLKVPQWVSRNGTTTITLYGTPGEAPPDAVLRMQGFLGSLQAGASFTREQYEAFFEGEISERTARNDLSAMVNAGHLARAGKASATTYKATGLSLPDVAGS